MQFITDFIKTLVPEVSDETLLNIISLAKLRYIGKGSEFVYRDEVPRNFYILKSGIARSYFIDKKGKDHTKTLYAKTEVCGPLTALIKKEPSKFSYDCLTDCEVIEFDYYRLHSLASKNIELSKIQIKMYELIHIRNDQRIEDLAYLDATDRYLKIRKEINNIDNLIPQYCIASFLNITPTQLSRIRKKLFSD